MHSSALTSLIMYGSRIMGKHGKGFLLLFSRRVVVDKKKKGISPKRWKKCNLWDYTVVITVSQILPSICIAYLAGKSGKKLPFLIRRVLYSQVIVYLRLSSWKFLICKYNEIIYLIFAKIRSFFVEILMSS